jgi:plasmid maintenance system killer protein
MRLNDQFRLIVRFENVANARACVVLEAVDYH